MVGLFPCSVSAVFQFLRFRFVIIGSMILSVIPYYYFLRVPWYVNFLAHFRVSLRRLSVFILLELDLSRVNFSTARCSSLCGVF